MTVTITLTLAGSDTGPFNLYSNVDGYSSPFQTNVPRGDFLTGLTTGTVPDGTTEILVRSTGVCQRNLYLSVAGAPATTTTTSTAAPSTTTTTSTGVPPEFRLAQIGTHAEVDGCSTGSIFRIYLNATDYALFIANSSQFAGLGGGAPTTCTAIARTITGFPISGYLYDNQGITWKLTGGSFTYNSQQC
jgi:hypothetical protein